MSLNEFGMILFKKFSHSKLFYESNFKILSRKIFFRNKLLVRKKIETPKMYEIKLKNIDTKDY